MRIVPGSGAVVQVIFNQSYGVQSFNVSNGGIGYASTNPPDILIQNTNTYTNATHIAIGHTPQFTKGINSICNNTVWRCDIGMSKAFLTHNNTRTKSLNNTHTHTHTTSLNNVSLSSSLSNSFKHGDIQILHIKNGVPHIINE